MNNDIKLRRLKCLLLLPLYAILQTGCSKSDASNATLLVTVLRGSDPLPQAVVNLQTDTAGGKAPVLIASKSCDAQGEAYFDELGPGYYFITAGGYSKADQAIVNGSMRLLISLRKGQNHNTVTVYTTP